MAFYAPIKVTQAIFEGHHHHPYGPVDNTFSDCDEDRANDEDCESGWELAHYFPGNGIWTNELIPSVITGDMAFHAPVKVTQAIFEGHHHHPFGSVDNTFSDCDEDRANDEDCESGWELAHYFPGNEIWTKELIPSVGIMTLAPDPAIVVAEKLTPPPTPTVESPTKTSFDEKSSGYYSTSSYHGQAEPSIGSQAGHISSSWGPSGGQRAFRNCVHK